MNTLGKLLQLIERMEWVIQAYRGMSAAYTAGCIGFVQATSHPREAQWKADPVIASFLKISETQLLAFQSLQKISQMLAEELAQAVAAVQQTVEPWQARESELAEELERHFLVVQKAADKRALSLEGKSDLWKSDLDLKMAIKRYIAKETELYTHKEAADAVYSAEKAQLLQEYYRGFNEYALSTSGHLHILVADVSEVVQAPVERPPLLHPPSPVVSGPGPACTAFTAPYQLDRFEELYGQLAKPADGHCGKYPYLADLSVRGCGLFYVPKITGAPVFLVATSTGYLHAFSVGQVLSAVSSDLFIKKSPGSPGPTALGLPGDDAALKRALSADNEGQLEEINLHLLENLHQLGSLEKFFPVAIADKKFSLSQNGREIHVEDRDALFFANKIKIIGRTPEQARKFFHLIRLETLSPAADEAPMSELLISWPQRTLSPPWE